MNRPHRLPARISAAAMFAAAFLVFTVQPMTARALLPWYGGAASVWTASLLFFQAALVAGYLWAHGLSTRVAPRTQAILHAVLLGLAALALPVAPDPGWAPAAGSAGALRVFATLAATVGVAFVAAAATTPLLSSWLVAGAAAASPKSAAGPPGIYRLFAVGNAGSLLGLLLYPTAIEPFLGLAAQQTAWSVGFAAFAVLTLVAAFLALRPSPASGSGSVRPRSKPPRPPLAPAAASAIGAFALIASTAHLTRNVAAVPLLWVIPLAVYLLTWILAFRRSTQATGGAPPGAAGPGLGAKLLLPLLFASSSACLLLLVREGSGGTEADIRLQIVAVSAFLFASCRSLHGEAARRAPTAERLTGYYLALSVGGAAGGLLATLASGPLLPIPYVWEFPAAVALSVAAPAFLAPPRPPGLRVVLLRATAAAGFGLALSAILLGHGEPVFASRNFHGLVRVFEWGGEGTPGWRRDLWNGPIGHGSQFLAPERRREPTLYYHRGTGVAAALDLFPGRGERPLRVGVIGLGTGTIAAYAREGDLFRFHEIDPAVETAARRFFTFLSDAPGGVEVAIGDGRLRLAEEDAAGEPRWDVLVLDAFSGDAIPVHLLTVEAFELYERRLAPDGVLAAHVSNRHLDLAPMAVALGRRLGFAALVFSTDEDPDRLHHAADWVLLTRNADFLSDPEVLRRMRPRVATAREREGVPRLWTDDYASILPMLR